MKKWLIIAVVAVTIGVGFGLYNRHERGVMVSPGGESKKVEKPYDKYSFEQLVVREDMASEIKEEGEIFFYESEGRKISGMVKRPTDSHPIGVIVMARGYVDKESYVTGMGTKNAATYYASRGYITYAPDFSGYGSSDPEDPNALGARLVKPVEILDLIASVRATTELPIYLWGHSNGGQVMLSVAEVLGERQARNIQAAILKVRGLTLWAPVSKPFPYNILYYTDEAEDQGKWLRGEIAKFEADYDVYNYSIDRYLEWIKIPLMIHQGTVDDAVPVEWSRELVEKLEEKEVEHTYYEYAGADHNMRPNWNTVVGRDIEWFGSLN
ncbi:MAG: hypothetical protein Fur0011_3830 [Candidatus Microgenomates bacterium]